MRIAYLINRYPAISHSFIRREIQAVERHGHRVQRIALRGWKDELPGEDDQAERMKTRYVLRDGPLPVALAFLCILLIRPARLARALRLAWRASRRAERPFLIHLIYLCEACRVVSWLRAEQAELLHAHFGTNSAEVAMLVHMLGGPPWSFTVHGPEEFDKATLIALPEKLKRASFIVAVSSFGRSQLFRYMEQNCWDKVKVVQCGIERRFHDGQWRENATSTRLVCVGRLCEQKGQLLLIDAVRTLVNRGLQFELVLAGDGEMRREIQAQITQDKLDKQVRITGWINGDQVREELLSARALVLPSFAEGLPVVIMEAMALRRPVISTYVAGIPELVVAGENGWLVPAGDAGALADAMMDCLEAPAETIARFGEAARSRVLARHDIDLEASKLIGHFEAAIAKEQR